MSNAWKVDMVIFSPRGHFYSSESENKVYICSAISLKIVERHGKHSVQGHLFLNTNILTFEKEVASQKNGLTQ